MASSFLFLFYFFPLPLEKKERKRRCVGQKMRGCCLIERGRGGLFAGTGGSEWW